MSKNRIWLMLLALLAMLMAFTCAEAAEEENVPAQFRLPASLRIIDEEAFEGTSFEFVDLPESVEEIGDRAFANIESLKVLKISRNARAIGVDILSGSDRAVISAPMDSLARTWAAANRVPFAPVATMTASNGTVQVNSASNIGPNPVLTDDGSDEKHEIPTARAAGEIKTDTFKEGFAWHVQGRAPPTVG